MERKLLIFDLDGTLIDSQRDLANSVNAMLAHMGRAALPEDVVASYVGNGAPVLVRKALGADAAAEDVERALAYFIAYYAEHKLDHTVLYPGVEDALKSFARQNAAMAVLTNKPVNISNAIVAGLGIAERFFRVYGGNSFDQKKPNPIGIQSLMQESGIAATQTVMVGDSYVDVQTARNAGVRCCGVTYGLQPESFEQHPPDFLVGRMEDLGKFVFVE
jgi:phosphoglycolate phosphatase